MKNLILALAAIGSFAVSMPATVQEASAQPTTRVIIRESRPVVRRPIVRPRPIVRQRPIVRPARCVIVKRTVRGPRGVVRRITERRCR